MVVRIAWVTDRQLLGQVNQASKSPGIPGAEVTIDLRGAFVKRLGAIETGFSKTLQGARKIKCAARENIIAITIGHNFSTRC